MRGIAILVFDGFVKQMDLEYIHSLTREGIEFRYPLKMLPFMGWNDRFSPQTEIAEKATIMPIIRFKLVGRGENEYYEGYLESLS